MTKAKLEKLENYLKELGSVAVAYSAGIDSTFLLKFSHDVLKEKVVAVTAASVFSSNKDIVEAKVFCCENKINHIVVDFFPLKVRGLAKNSPNRCYLCKKALMKQVLAVAKQNGTAYVIEGSNVDDMSDYRPGRQALSELNIKSPLLEVGLTKKEIRILAQEMGIQTWDKPSNACLASRFAYGEIINGEKLQMIDNAELFLLEKGFVQSRVRIHGDIARIEVMPQDFDKLILYSDIINQRFQDYGFKYVTMDLQGYRKGSMNL